MRIAPRTRQPETARIHDVSPVNRGTRGSKTAWQRIGIVLVVFFALFLSWRYTPLADFITGERIVAWARSLAHVWWAPLAVIAIYTPAAFLMFPRPLIAMFAALAFGPWRGFAVSMIGILVSALATYAAGRTLREQTVQRLAGRRLAKTSAAPFAGAVLCPCLRLPLRPSRRFRSLAWSLAQFESDSGTTFSELC
ncbi:MAG: putative Phospholipase/Transphosphatidylase [Betaproteobacteria bacterium]|jgi:phospholipase D1/2|nr:putative Phospholipase/Transphosphatidylase [Betaproteobacteria bacterium]MEA3153297.1 phospholipase [Betaproteobacteria bacterium]